MININQLSLTFGTHKVLHEVSLDVRPGEAFGLVGESGSGKSTILRCLAGLYTHWQGAMHVDGKTLGHQIDRERSRLMQMVFQDPYGSLHPRHTIATALSEPLHIHGIGDIDRRVDDMLFKVGLNASFRWRYPHQLSGGQRQRVAIARALILQPRVLLLDEPTSALDVSVQAEILNLLDELRVKEGLTYLLVTHDLGVVVHMCERLAVMQQGRIVDTLDAETLRIGGANHAYTKSLVAASRSYQREAAFTS